ncbi:uncharacterized protein NDAI_0F01270 [Naumovozyma dairenensis CBS 421]|uniref:AAA+ ATPase domain-containing protein n=1 Tax=Naumovozyma dairenensis (strain ATCC 10597 / BCRC 20456 / CBS 421 / NBRC 0211 / NRRL Y-12639) TaxID=1071378 RepID=G0WCD5_NAUDC|nr:hypothetical protein NDAI_0F01270 [Naumovozyma dairenensis CBS 421]CCD25446.1 hypothetical protein NDAI_0F01270 [Naumovozyma dairenensis CBS 421]
MTVSSPILAKRTRSSTSQTPMTATGTKNKSTTMRRKQQDLSKESIAMNKLGRIKLSDEQQRLRDRILEFSRKNLGSFNDDKKPAIFVIEGDAGTGKSVILNSLFNEIQRLSVSSLDNEDVLVGTNNYLIVNHPEMLKLYHRICHQFSYIKKSSLERPTTLVNTLQKTNSMADIIIIDEAHLLSTAKDAWKRFYGENHLSDLIKLGKVLVVVYDDKQALRMGSYWDENAKDDGASLKWFYDQFLSDKKEWYNLKQQFRVAAPEDVLDWIDKISIQGIIPEYPKSCLLKEEEGKRQYDSLNFDFKIWEDCGEMYEALRVKNEEMGQCRMLSTYDFPYRLDGKDYFVTCGDNFKVRWDRYAPREQLPWSERETFDEVGSVYTIQGFDLNYAGVILGKSVSYDKANNCIKLLPEFYDDHAGFTKKKNIKNADSVKQKIIMNSINVLLTRGVKGLYVYAYDPELRRILLESKAHNHLDS